MAENSFWASPRWQPLAQEFGQEVGPDAEIGDDCYLYHQVTLGVARTSGGKRHPTVGNNVIIGAGAKVLGPIRVGDNARVGSNAVVLDDVPDNTTVVGIPARPVDRQPTRDRNVPAFDPYGIPCDGSLDPLLRDLDQMHCELAELEARVARLYDVRPEPETLHHAGTKAFDQRVGIGQEVQHLSD